MKRDMDLVRDILILVSESNHPVDAGAFVTKENDLQKVVYTIEIMNAAGLVKADMQKVMGGIYVNATIKSLTWTGNDYLDAIREDQVWKKVKRIIAKTAVSAPFAVVKALAEKFVAELVLQE